MRVRILIAASLIVVAACGGTGSTTNPSPSTGSASGGPSGGTGSTLSAIIDGSTWNQPNVTARYSTANPPYLEVDSLDAKNNLFGFLVRRFGTNTGGLTPGTYEIGPTNSNANFVTVGGTPTWTASPGVAGIAARGSGSVTLTSFSTTTRTASGTFSFVLVNGSSTKTVSNGVFNVKF